MKYCRYEFIRGTAGTGKVVKKNKYPKYDGEKYQEWNYQAVQNEYKRGGS